MKGRHEKVRATEEDETPSVVGDDVEWMMTMEVDDRATRADGKCHFPAQPRL